MKSSMEIPRIQYKMLDLTFVENWDEVIYKYLFFK